MDYKDKCATCGTTESEDGFYEYRGFVFCQPHFDEGIKKVDYKRGELSKVFRQTLYKVTKDTK
jgi:recombinational DNA repair protein (RecF pathway)